MLTKVCNVTSCRLFLPFRFLDNIPRLILAKSNESQIAHL